MFIGCVHKQFGVVWGCHTLKHIFQTVPLTVPPNLFSIPNMPTISVKLPPMLAQFAGKAEFKVQGATVSAALDDLDHACPGLSDKIRNEKDEPRQHVLIYVNDDEVRDLQGLKTPITSGTTIFVVAAVSGG